MNLAGDNTKRLFRSLRTGSTPTSIGLWAGVNAVEQLRKRRRPPKVLLVKKDLEPGETYVVRIPEEGQAPISKTLSEGRIGSELMTAAATLLTTEEPPPEEEPEPELPPIKLSRRKRRRARRLERLQSASIDLSLIPRRQRKELNKAERKAQRRPSRRRVRKARKLQASAAKYVAKAERKAAASPRAGRRHKRSQEVLSEQEGGSDNHSTRRQRRKLARAAKEVETTEA